MAKKTEMNDSNDRQILAFVTEFTEVQEEKKRKLPYHLNLLDEAKPNEMTHSRILGKLLSYKTEDGQYSILKSLFDYVSTFNVLSEKINSPEITIEDEDIDIWVRDKKGGYAVIIENKSNGADDQPKQLKRYIDKTIEQKFCPEQIYVAYLPPDDGKDPDDESWGNYKDEFKDRYAKLPFNPMIIGWLEKTQEELQGHADAESKVLIPVTQYVDYLKGRFYLRNKEEKKMNESLREFIKKDLNWGDKNPAGQYDAVVKKIDDTKALIKQLEALKQMEIKALFDRLYKKTKEWRKASSKNKDVWETLEEKDDRVAYVELKDPLFPSKKISICWGFQGMRGFVQVEGVGRALPDEIVRKLKDGLCKLDVTEGQPELKGWANCIAVRWMEEKTEEEVFEEMKECVFATIKVLKNLKR